MTNVLSQSQIRERILAYLCKHPGSRHIDVLRAADIGGDDFALNYLDLIQELVDAGEIVKLCYILPKAPYHSNHLLYPKGFAIELETTHGGYRVSVRDPNGDLKRILFPKKTEISITKL